MIRFIISAACLICMSFSAIGNDKMPVFLDGDIIFQTSKSSLSLPISLATHSRFTHMGIIYHMDGKPMVLEASSGVELTSLTVWIQHGVDEHFVVKRLKDQSRLTSDTRARMIAMGQELLGRPYDIYFGWNDDKFYCSELVWKLYNRGTGIQIGKLARMRDFDLSNPIVMAKLREVHGDDIPLDQKVVSPSTMFKSELLETIFDNTASKEESGQ